MIKSLKRKMLITIMFFITAIIIAFLLVINLIPAQRSYRESITFLNQMMVPDKPGNPLAPPDNMDKKNPDMLFHSNLIRITLNQNGTINSWNSNREDLYEEDTISSLASEIYKKNHAEGSIEGYYYVMRPSGNGYTICLLDNRISFHNLRTVLIITLFAGVVAWVLFLLLTIYLVNRMTHPINEAFVKQKQFIADAGHELKTPVAVIAANAEVLAAESGQNKWLSYIQTETKRMDHLIKNLMLLAQIDDSQAAFVQTPINLSQIVTGAALPYESLAYENGTVMEFDITPNLMIHGNKEQMEQLIIILINNAIKYGKERGLIRISLKKQHHTILLSVYNTGIGIRPEEADKIFERFYRVEKERSRKSGNYGLGLAIAKSIVTEHHGKISVESIYGESIEFRVELPEK